MAIHMHQPPLEIEASNKEPVVFLAGPIQGAAEWQMRAVEILQAAEDLHHKALTIHVANPRRDYLDGEFSYAAQVSWEKAGLLRAAKYGAIIFWFAAQDSEQPYEQGRAYAQTSRIEFGRVMGWHDYNPDINIAIGIEPGYQGSERYYLTCAEEKNLRVYTTLEGVSMNALLTVTQGGENG
jgi:hypothetical protein